MEMQSVITNVSPTTNQYIHTLLQINMQNNRTFGLVDVNTQFQLQNASIKV